MMPPRFVVAILQDLAGGWLVDADCPEDALAIVRTTDRHAATLPPAELLVWTEDQYRRRYLIHTFGPQWRRLSRHA